MLVEITRFLTAIAHQGRPRASSHDERIELLDNATREKEHPVNHVDLAVAHVKFRAILTAAHWRKSLAKNSK